MKKLINVNDRVFSLVNYNEETGNIDATRIETAPDRIGSITVVPEDCELQYTKCGGEVINRDVNKDDIILTFYSDSMGTPFIVVKSDEFIQAINAYKEYEQKQKEEWASKQTSCDACASPKSEA